LTSHPCVCPRVYYAETPYGSLSPETPSALHKFLGSMWMVPLCGANGSPQIELAVSALNTDVRVDGEKVFLPPVGGNSFFAMPVTIDPNALLTPERAAVVLAAATGRRVARVPELVLPGRPWAPQLNRWKFTLEAPAAVRRSTDGKKVLTAELYLGPSLQGRGLTLFIGGPPATPTFESGAPLPRSGPALPGSKPPAARQRHIEHVSYRSGAAGQFIAVTPDTTGV
jgi:hypothetical protein